MPKQFRFIFIVFIVWTMMSLAVKVQARGLLLKVEHFVPAVFYQQQDTFSVLTYNVIKNSNLTLRIFDFFGRRVFEKKLGFFYQGKYEFAWDARDSWGNAVKPGFYKCEISAVSVAGQQDDKDYTVIKVAGGAEGFIRSEIEKGTAKLKTLPFKITGFVRGITELDTKGAVNWDNREMQIDLRGRHREDLEYGLRFFPYQNPGKEFRLSDYIEASVKYYAGSFSVAGGYNDYIEDLNDPLNLLADYRMGAGRLSLTARSSLSGSSGIELGLYRLTELDEYAIQAHAHAEILDGLKISGAGINRISGNCSNNVISGWCNFSKLRGTDIAVQAAGSLASTASDTGVWSALPAGFGAKADIRYGFPGVSKDIGNFTVACGFEYIQKEFISYFSDLPNGSDNMGGEIIAGYGKEFGEIWFRSLSFEIKKAYFTSIDGSLARQKFRPTASMRLTDSLDVYAHYDYQGTEDITGGASKPLRRVRSATGEMHYCDPGKKWDNSLNYTVAKTDADSRTEYTSTHITAGYHFTDRFFCYTGCEKIIEFNSDNRTIDCYLTTAGLEWTLMPAFKTKTRIQAGLVNDNMLLRDNRITYYLDFQHYFFDRLSVLLVFGSLTNLEPSPNFSTQIKFEF